MGRFYLVVDSKKESKVITLEIIRYKDGYLRLKSDNLLKNINEKFYKILLDNGLFSYKKYRAYNTYFLLHRLVACLYDDISNLDIHHIDENRGYNHIDNLVPMTKERNISLNSLEYNKVLRIGQEEKRKWLKKLSKKNKNLANNPYIQFEILKNALGTSIQEIYSHIKKKIKNIQTIRNIINYFYHFKEFIIWLEYSYKNIYEDLNKNVRLYP